MKERRNWKARTGERKKSDEIDGFGMRLESNCKSTNFLERESQQIHSSISFSLTFSFCTPDQFFFLVSSLSLSLGLNEEGEGAEEKETHALKLSS